MSAPAAVVDGKQSASPLHERRDGDIAILTLDRSAQRNSLSERLLGDLSAAIARVSSDASVKVVVIAAHGPAFSSGHDLKELNARRTDVSVNPRARNTPI